VLQRPPYRLRVTRRCLVEDLGTQPDMPQLDLEELAEALSPDASAVVRTFLRDRSQTPEGQDRMSGLATGRAPIFILRHGARYRALTWYDEPHRVVWLLAAHFVHRSGEVDDSFAHFRRLGASALRPTTDDYTALEQEEASAAADAIFDAIPKLLAEAAGQPGREVRGRVGPVPVRLVFVDDGIPPPHAHLGVSMRWVDEPPDPPPDIVLAIVTRVYGHAYGGWEELPLSRDPFPGPSVGSEWVFEDFVSDWPRPTP